MLGCYGRRFGFDIIYQDAKNFKGWLLHISALPTFIVYSKTSMTFGDNRVPIDYHFPEVIITGRGAVVRQWSNKFIGMSMVFNFTNIGHQESLTIHNIKWSIVSICLYDYFIQKREVMSSKSPPSFWR